MVPNGWTGVIRFLAASLERPRAGRFFPSLALCLVLCGVVPCSATAQDTSARSSLWPEVSECSTWIFLGDSNTYSGRYVAILSAWLESAELAQRPEILNLGMSSETAAGTSEVDHPFKRPCVHERIEKTLAMTRPGVVFICYGMNDGIYEPFNPQVFSAYQAGMLALAEQIHESGAKLIVLTPPIFEADALENQARRFGPNRQDRYAFNAPFRNYDDVMAKMSGWCLENRLGADAVIDIRKALLTEKNRLTAEDPKFTFSRDGVHFNNVAHAILAEAVLKGLGAPPAILSSYPSNTSIEQNYKKTKLLRDAYLSAIGKNRPGLPAGLPVWHARKMAAGL